MSTQPSTTTSKRPSAPSSSTTTTAAPAKPTCNLHSLATIADRAQLTGPHTISVGENSIIHPHARLRAESGNVSVGKFCMVGEKAVVGGSAASSKDGQDERGGGAHDVVLADGVSVEPGAVVEEGTRMGEYSAIGALARVRSGAVVGRWCKVAPLCEVGEGEVLEDFSVVFGSEERRVDTVLREREEVREQRVEGRGKEVELLGSLIADGGGKWRG